MKELFLRNLKMECCMSMEDKIMQGGILSKFLLVISGYAYPKISVSRSFNKLNRLKHNN